VLSPHAPPHPPRRHRLHGATLPCARAPRARKAREPALSCHYPLQGKYAVHETPGGLEALLTALDPQHEQLCIAATTALCNVAEAPEPREALGGTDAVRPDASRARGPWFCCEARAHAVPCPETAHARAPLRLLSRDACVNSVARRRGRRRLAHHERASAVISFVFFAAVSSQAARLQAIFDSAPSELLRKAAAHALRQGRFRHLPHQPLPGTQLAAVV
jgi:hypothetical protein